MKTQWDLTLLYASETDPRIETDLVKLEKAYAAFARKYKGKPFTKTAPALAKALHAYEALLEAVASNKPYMYFMYRKELNAHDEHAEAKMRLFGERITKASNHVQFFELTIGDIPKNAQKKFLKHPALARYSYYLERIFKTACHDLSEPEEKILSLTAAPGSGMWVSGVEKALAARAVDVQGETVPLNAALSAVLNKERPEERRAWWRAIREKLKEVSEFSESEINALYSRKKIVDELRGFKTPPEGTVLAYENDMKSVDALVEAVTARFGVAHRFYALKKKLVGLPEFTYADRGAPLKGYAETIPFPKAAHMVAEAFAEASPEYARILEQYLVRGQIDVAPRAKKSGGAYCSSVHGLPTFVLLNHTNDFHSFTTLAHEMGHAIHSEKSAIQPILYDDYSVAVAETASTFFEGLAFSHATKALAGEARIKVLHDKIQDDIATVFRQIACYNFEKELHEKVRAEGWVPKEVIAQLMNKHMASYLGETVSLDPDDGYFFVSWSHIRRSFYVYTYAYGQLVSSALLAMYHENPRAISKVEEFLKAGRSDTPEKIFKKIGIDVTKPAFWSASIDAIEKSIDELEALVHSERGMR
jgi:oligoendopeptidase F